MEYLVLFLFLVVLTNSVNCHVDPVVLVHGGVDNLNTSRIIKRVESVKRAATLGYKILKRGGSVTDAVEQAMRILEDDENINAGYGATLNLEGEVEMDAGIMVGSNLSSGCVSGVKHIAHPISLARLIMEKTPHVGLAGEGAHRFAKEQGIPLLNSKVLVAPGVRKDLDKYLKSESMKDVTSGSAGVVVLDRRGHLAAGTSSGGSIGKIPGRVSDSSIVGAGFYAVDGIGAVVVTAFKVKIMEYFFLSPILALLSLVSGDRSPILLVHGGINSINQLSINHRLPGLRNATIEGYKILRSGGNIIDALETTIRILEDDPYFNTGYGSVLNKDGEIEMSACIMTGANLSSGGVTGIRNVRHPISVARLVMEKSPHFLLQGEGAKRFAQSHGIPLVPQSTLISPQSKEDYANYLKSINDGKKILEMMTMGCGDVGAIAMDNKGHLAVASSTGGRLGMLPGRMGAVALIGAGAYADDQVGAATVTGHGEAIARFVMANEIIHAMKRGFEAGIATRNVVKEITELFRKPTGAITLSKNGQIGISFTTEKMAWAYQLRDDLHYGVDDYDHFSERIKI